MACNRPSNICNGQSSFANFTSIIEFNELFDILIRRTFFRSILNHKKPNLEKILK